MKQDKISVAMATYNGARFLREQLDSLYAQSCPPDEIIVCDDASNDGTLAILEEYHQHYGLTYYQNNPGLGVNANFMRAIGLCTGDYICICDQDDIWLSNKIERLHATISKESKDIPVAVSSMRNDINTQGEIFHKYEPHPVTRGWEATLMSTNVSQGCTMIMNRKLADIVTSLYKNNPIADEVMYDVLISTTAAILGEKINLGEILMLYRHHDSNVVNTLTAVAPKNFWQKVNDMPTYYPFVMDYRIQELSIINKVLSAEPKGKEPEVFLNKIQQVAEKKHIPLVGLTTVLSIKQIPAKKKLKIALLSPISIFLKFILHHSTSLSKNV